MQLRPRALIVLVVSCAVAASGCGGDSGSGEVVARAAGEPTAPGETDGVGAPPEATAVGIVVDVAGDVRRPGVYRMPPGSRVHEAIDAAGGARPGASLGGLNRAAVLVDGQQVVVGAPDAASEEPGATGAGGGAGASAGTINLNTADAAALDELPGIGQVTAERIVASREEAGPFATIDDLDRVPGIGPATIESLRSVATT